MKNVRGILRGLALAGALWAGAAWAAAPDLVISYVTPSQTVAYPGDKITIDSGTRNDGGDTGWWKYCKVYYYFGTRTNDLSNKIGEGATPNYNEVNGIESGEVEDDSLSWTVPANTAPGTYYLICKADAENAISESKENNNTRAVKFTVRGIPSFQNVQWNGLRYVSDGDTAIAYGECVNIDPGSWVTINIYEDDVAGDDLVASNLSARVVRGTNGVCYFSKTWSAKWEDDASGDPEYYFTCTYSAYGKTATGNSGENDGAYLHVAKADARMTPSANWTNTVCSAACGNFYYDNVSTNDPGFRGATSASVPLTDDRIPIILVHGMSGDAKPKTLNYWYGWMNADPSGTLGYFNQAPMTNMFRVYRYVYDSTDFISTNAAKFAKFVNDFYATHTNFNERQVVIMAHSMGGLVSRYAMNINTQFAARVHRLITLGSPHQGSQGANPTWIKYSGPDDDSWFISGIYNTFKLHNNTAGCFDLAWYATNQIPTNALSEDAISAMSDTYQPDLLRRSLKNPFCGWSGMVTTNKHDYKMVMFGGSSTNQISDYLSKDWPDEPSGEVKTDHLGLWVATKIFRSMSYADGTGVGDNDGLVPLNSALLTDGNRHPNTTKYNLNATEGQQVDHASYLDVPVTMDSVKAVLLTQVRTYCRTSAGADLSAARWRLVEPKAENASASPWQKPGVRLPALTPGVTYTIQFKDVDGYTKPADISFTAKKSTTTAVTGTYTTAQETNHAPTGIALSNASVADGAPAGTLVGTLSATDPDSNETFTYSLVSGEGDTGNAWFTVSGNQLLTARVFDYEEYPAHYCRIQVKDHANATHEEAFTIQIDNLPDSPGELSGDAWINLKWDGVAGATSYRVDVTACGGSGSTYTLHSATLYTNKFKSGHRWKYILPDGTSAPSSSKGAVSNAPIYQTYTGTPNLTAHFLVGTNGIGIQTSNFTVSNQPSATLVFTNGAWNGGGVSNRSLLKVSCSFDGGVTWAPIGESQPKSGGDNGDVTFLKTVPLFGATNVAFKIEAPNACTLSNYLRGAYVSYAAVKFASASGDFSANGCRLDGFPAETTETSYRVSGLPAGTPYWYKVEALVDGAWTSVDSGVKQSADALGTPQNLRATDRGSDWLFLEWDPVADADGYVLQVTPVIAGGTPEILSTCPNVQLSSVTNTSGWNYSTNHSVVSSNWFYPMADNPAGDYHALTVNPTPGLQSPVLDLSGYSEASLDFVMRKRGNGGTVWLYWSADGQTWHESGSVYTNQDMIYNNRIHSLPVPAEALAANVRLELCVTNATGTSTSGGNGVGIRNLHLTATPRGGPDYEASSAIEELADEPAFILEGLDPNTTYHFHVQTVDNAWNTSAWSTNNSATTLANAAPTGLVLFHEPVDENQPVGTLVGLMEATDPDGDALTYELVSGDGAADNASFAIVGDELLLAELLSYADGDTRHIRIRASDPFGNSVEDTFPIIIREVAEETPVASVVPTLAPAANGDFQLGWESVEGITKYEVYISTNLSEVPPFKYSTTLTNTTTLTNSVEGTVKFWVIRPVR